MVKRVRYQESAGRAKQEAKEYKAKRLLEIKDKPQIFRKLTFWKIAFEKITTLWENFEVQIAVSY